MSSMNRFSSDVLAGARTRRDSLARGPYSEPHTRVVDLGQPDGADAASVSNFRGLNSAVGDEATVVVPADDLVAAPQREVAEVDSTAARVESHQARMAQASTSQV